MNTATANPASPVNVKKAERRTLRFNTLDEILAEGRRIAAPGVRHTGNWNAAQTLDHVARPMVYAIDGFPFKAPLPIRIFGRLMKGRILRKGMSPGITPPARIRAAFEADADLTVETALGTLEEAIARASVDGSMTHASPIFGPLSYAEWVQVQCRHAELHFSFFFPEAN